MLDYNTQIKGSPILSLHAGRPIGNLGKPIIIPSMLQIAGFYVDSPELGKNKKIKYVLQADAIRELSKQGVVIDSVDDISPSDDLLRLEELIKLDFDLLNCIVKTKSGKKLGQVTDYVLDGFLMVRQIVVKPTLMKSFNSQPLYLPRTAIVEIKNETIFVEDTAQKIALNKMPAKMNPDFVNPFAKNRPAKASETAK